MKEVKIAELKAHLSSHLAAVRKGETIIVCDRSTPIARLTPVRQVQDGDLVLEEAADPPSEARKIVTVQLNSFEPGNDVGKAPFK